MRNSILKSYFKKFIRNEVFLSVIIVFVLAIGIIGTSYALYMDVDTDVDYQLVEVGDLSVGFDNGDNTFTLSYITPTDDDIATGKVESEIAKEISSKNFFSFYIYNNGNYTANYNIKLVPQEGSISSEYLRYQICKDNIENCNDIKTLSDVTNNIIFIDELSPNRTETQTNPSAYYFLRVWVKSDYVVKENDKVVLKVEIDAKNASGYLDNDNTLVGRLLSDERVKINNTVPKFDGIADYVVTGDSSSGELGLFKAEDDYGISYYYRGAQSYNYVNFAGFTWRVVRINGDGTIRLILEGTLDKVCADYEKDADGNCLKFAGATSAYNIDNFDNAHIGYMYGLTNMNSSTGNKCLKLNETNEVTDYINEYSIQELCETNGGKWTTTRYEATHANVKDSTIKSNIDNFYEEYLIDYEKSLADTLFCNDKSLSDKNPNINIKGVGGYQSFYSAFERLFINIKNNDDGTITLSNKQILIPTLKCAEGQQNNFSRFTSNLEKSKNLINGILVNNDLKYPISLLSADEVVFAGSSHKNNNTLFYLYNAYNKDLISDNWWLNSPLGYLVDSTGMPGVFAFKNGKINLADVSTDYGVRPVINLKSDVLYKTGDGTSETPYEIK